MGLARPNDMTTALKAGRYELGEELGRGAMGVVYRAQDPVIGRPVAVKTVRLTEQPTGMSHEELLERFKTEARAASLLTHPNIVVVYDDAGEVVGLFYITMELVEGVSLQAQLDARQSFPLPRVLRLMQQACSALDFAHQHRIVHRDIKPANLMLTPDDTLKITDFGTAKILKMGATQTAHTIGTPSYMSPEQIKGRPVDGRSDIFSLGVVLYELVTGHKPFPGESVTTVIYKIVNEDPVPPREIDPSIHPGLSAVIARALAKPVGSRFQSGRELWEALQNYRSYKVPEAPSNAAAAKASSAATRAMAATQVLRQPILTAPPEKRRNSFYRVAFVLIAIIAAKIGYRVWPALLRSLAARRRALLYPLAKPLPPPPPGIAPRPSQNQPAPASTIPPAAESAKPPEAPAITAEAPVPNTKPVEAPAPAAANATPQKPRALPASQDAAEWKGIIEQVLAEDGLSNKVHVAAAGNNGDVDPARSIRARSISCWKTCEARPQRCTLSTTSNTPTSHRQTTQRRTALRD